MSVHEKVTQLQAWKSVLSGITLGLITPNQVGDIVGKSLFIQQYAKLQAAAANLTGSVSQAIAMASLFAPALRYILHLNQVMPFREPVLELLLTLIPGVLLVFLFTRLSRLVVWIKIEKLKPYIESFANYPPAFLFKLWVYSTLRMAVLTSQYVILLHLFKVGLHPAEAFACILVVFSIQSFVPSFILIELGMRGMIALWIISPFTDNQPGILASAYALWFINMIVPAIFGILAILTLKWSKK